jgi:hypothetical protein
MAVDWEERQAAFRLEEYKALRKEIEIYTQESRALERYTIVALGATWAWLIVNKVHEWVPWTIPPLLVVAVALRGLGFLAHFRHMGEYLAEVEKSFGVQGWEQKRPGAHVARVTNLLAWVLLVLSIIALLWRDALIAR